MTAEREMTLHEWVGKLPEIHRANREFLALQARIAELERAVAGANHDDRCAYWKWDWKYSWHDTDCTCGA